MKFSVKVDYGDGIVRELFLDEQDGELNLFRDPCPDGAKKLTLSGTLVGISDTPDEE